MPAINVQHKTGVRSLFYNAGFLVFSRISEKAIRFFYLLVLARLLGPHMLGLYNYGLAWYLIFLPLATWAFGALLSIYLGRKPENAEDIVSATLLFRLLTTTLTAVCCLVIGLFSNSDSMSQSLISILVIALVGRSLAMWGRSCFVAVELSQYSAGLEIGFRIVEVFCGLVYLSIGGGIIGLGTIHAACWVAEGIVALALVRNRLCFRKFFAPWSLVRQVAVEAFPITVNTFLSVAMIQSGFIVLKHLAADTRVLGFYAVAFQLVVNTTLIPEALGSAALPILSRAYGRGTGSKSYSSKPCSRLVCFVLLFLSCS